MSPVNPNPFVAPPLLFAFNSIPEKSVSSPDHQFMISLFHSADDLTAAGIMTNWISPSKTSSAAMGYVVCPWEVGGRVKNLRRQQLLYFLARVISRCQIDSMVFLRFHRAMNVESLPSIVREFMHCITALCMPFVSFEKLDIPALTAHDSGKLYGSFLDRSDVGIPSTERGLLVQSDMVAASNSDNTDTHHNGTYYLYACMSNGVTLCFEYHYDDLRTVIYLILFHLYFTIRV
jgi:hypothetical protein